MNTLSTIIRERAKQSFPAISDHTALRPMSQRRNINFAAGATRPDQFPQEYHVPMFTHYDKEAGATFDYGYCAELDTVLYYIVLLETVIPL